LKLETVEYKYAVIATDTIIFTLREQELKVLLIKMKKAPFQNCWAAPGGLVRGDESLGNAAKRNLYETTGVKMSIWSNYTRLAAWIETLSGAWFQSPILL
jgi:8-oxo-dGTP diphosphatase